MQNNTFSTLFVGQNLIKLSYVDSTNNYLKLLTSKSEPLPEGTAIMADNQFAGRGQRESVWQSSPGQNLTFSIYLLPGFIPLTKSFLLNVIVSIGVYDALYPYLGDDLSVKWPNDIYYKHYKIGGILIENAISGIGFKHSIVGIGLNVNQLDFDDAISAKASSLSLILQRNVDLLILFNEICYAIESAYLNVKQGDAESFINKYVEKLYLFNERAMFRQNENIFEGQIVGVSTEGYLQIRLENGNILSCGIKEVEFL